MTSVSQALAVVDKIGYPIMIKASEGGGGKGIRKCEDGSQLEMAFRQVQGEVPGSPIFIMKLAKKARHLEVQLLADSWGDAIAVFGRDCSIQRRHQKIIEEGPVTAASPEVWKRMERSAVNLAKEVGYVGAGTVEYLFFEGDQYSFLELNPRLQVEHPVTELISGVNLPAAQLQVAMGIPLHQIRGVRLMYGESPLTDTKIDFDTRDPIPLPGHVIACRVTAENPEEKFQPTAGQIQELNFRSTPDVWGYFSVGANGGIHEFSDSQFGHLFAHGENREAARRNMVLALKELSIRGEIRTTVEYLRTILEQDEFVKNQISTSWLEVVMARSDVSAEKPETQSAVLLGAIFKAQASCAHALKDFMGSLERGQLPSPNLHNALVAVPNLELIYEGIKYRFDVSKSGPEGFFIQYKDWSVNTDVMKLSDDGILVLLNNKKHIVYGQQFSAGMRLTVDGKTCLFTQEYDPTNLRSSMQGKLVRYLVASGTHIDKGQPYAEMEVMKMFIEIKAPEAGVITTIKPEGSVLEAGDLIAQLALDEPDKIKKAVMFSDRLAPMDQKLGFEEANVILKSAIKKLELVLDGYKLNEISVENALNDMMDSLRDPSLPLAQFLEAISPLSGRIPQALWNAFDEIASRYAIGLQEHRSEPTVFPVLELRTAIDNALANAGDAEKAALISQLDTRGVARILDRYAQGNHSYAIAALTGLLERYIAVESLFNNSTPEEVVKTLRKQKTDIDSILRYTRAHHSVSLRSRLVLAVLHIVEKDFSTMLGDFVPILTRLSVLAGPDYAVVSLKTRQLIMRHQLPSSEQRRAAITAILNACEHATAAHKVECLTPLLDQSQPIEDIIFSLFDHRLPEFQKLAMEGAIRRIYAVYNIPALEVGFQDNGIMIGRWTFGELKLKSNPALNLISSPSCHDMAAVGAAAEERAPPSIRAGAMVYFKDHEAFKKDFSVAVDAIRSVFSVPNSSVLYVVVKWTEQDCSDEQLVQYLRTVLAPSKQEIVDKLMCKRITFILNYNDVPKYFTFRPSAGLEEDIVLRNIEPCYAVHMELKRLRNFEMTFVQSNNLVHLFSAKNPSGVAVRSNRAEPGRLFARVLVRKLDVIRMKEATTTDAFAAHPEAEYAFLEALDALEVAGAGNTQNFRNNHVFINVLSPVDITMEAGQKIVQILGETYQTKTKRLNVSHFEFAIPIRDQSGKVVNCRYYFSNPTGFLPTVDTYIQIYDASTNTVVHEFQPQASLGVYDDAPYFDGKPIDTPYPLNDGFQKQRLATESLQTVYVYDFLLLIRSAVASQWQKFDELKKPQEYMHVKELILDPQNRNALISTSRKPGQNDIAMVAWDLTLFTPFSPQGRNVIIIANDISMETGTFGTEEDQLFYLASKHARERKIPRIYLSANSGARIGLAEEVRSKFQVAWVDNDYTHGQEYIYLSEADYKGLEKSVTAQRIETENKEVRYKVTDIIGTRNGLGVENLSGSGLIAGETSLAYDEIFTLTYVTGRSVGIGAYLCRLGQRCIQKVTQPMILTGYLALNKLLGREVYSSNSQLGGPDIMYTNGVSHLTVQNDMEGVVACLAWLNFVPDCRLGSLPITPVLHDPIDRAIDFMPTTTAYDVRHMIGGVREGNAWRSGFFDKDSFTEVLGGWAKTVVCGRARLGGYPIGVVAVETRTVEQIVPADPADPSSKEQIQLRAGQVWYPDSAFKTAQAIHDMIAEDIPLMIFANWRGFSGGMQDMFDEVLKYGSLIVDSLRLYKQPVFVYIPPFGTLRGGAWVVVDSTINEQYMEMYADPTARGGVLEAEGTVEVKFRKFELVQAAHRLDPKLKELAEELRAANDKSQAGKTRAASAIQADIRAREEAVLPYYHVVATAFCDLHDTPGRMQAKNVIRDVVDWKQARSYFYWRMRRNVLEVQLSKDVQNADNSLDWKAARDVVTSWQKEAKTENDDRAFVEWAAREAESFPSRLAKIRQSSVTKQLQQLLQSNASGVLEGFLSVYHNLDAETKAKLAAGLK